MVPLRVAPSVRSTTSIGGSWLPAGTTSSSRSRSVDQQVTDCTYHDPPVVTSTEYLPGSTLWVASPRPPCGSGADQKSRALRGDVLESRWTATGPPFRAVRAWDSGALSLSTTTGIEAPGPSMTCNPARSDAMLSGRSAAA